MERFLFFFGCIIAGCSGNFVHYDEVKFLKDGDLWNVYNKHNEDSCTIISNDNQTFKYEYKSGNISFSNKKIEHKKYNCDALLTVSVNDTGIWTFKNPSGDKKYFIVVTKELKFAPVKKRSWIGVFENNYMLPYLVYDFNLVPDCYLVNHTSMYIPTQKSFNRCEAHLKALRENDGTWSIYAVKKNDLAIRSDFHLTIIKTEVNPEIRQLNVTVQRGKTNVQFLTIPGLLKYCKVTDPHGNVVLESSNDNCDYIVPLVTSYHAGIWTYQYYLNRKQEPLLYHVHVTTIDNEPVKVNVTYKHDKVIMMCNTTGFYEINTCKYKNPSGKICSIMVGSATNKIEYYGKGFGKGKQHQECGIVINKPEATDYGTWNCLITTTESESVNTLINIEREQSKVRIFEENKNIYVKEGQPFKIKCRVNRRLSYCWLRSPNGTIYNVATIKNSLANTLLYEGSGYHSGECGAHLPNASRHSDKGVWNCHMGIEGGSDVKANVTVDVADSLVFPVNNKIMILPTTKTIELTCIILPGTNFENNHCRWVSPNGSAIFENYDHRYIVTRNITSCSLKIQATASHLMIGNWTCVISDKQNKMHTNIEMYYAPSELTWIAIICMLIAVIFGVLSSYFIYYWIKGEFSEEKEMLLTSNPVEISPAQVTYC